MFLNNDFVEQSNSKNIFFAKPLRYENFNNEKVSFILYIVFSIKNNCTEDN
jgi:hypothetical protein